MDLGSGLFSVNCINLNESDQFGLELENLIRLWNLSLDQLNDASNEERTTSTQEPDYSKTKLIKCFNLTFRISLVENDSLSKADCKQLLDNVLNKVKEVNYYDEINFIQRMHGLSNYILVQTENRLDVLES